MANTKHSDITPLTVAIRDAQRLIAADKLPSYKELAKRWHCSIQRVPLVLKQVRNAKPKISSSISKPAIAKSTEHKHPILAGLAATLLQTENDLLNIEGYVSAIPGLAASEIKQLVKKSQAGIWGELHSSMSDTLESVQQLSKPSRKKRTKKSAK